MLLRICYFFMILPLLFIAIGKSPTLQLFSKITLYFLFKKKIGNPERCKKKIDFFCKFILLPLNADTALHITTSK